MDKICKYYKYQKYVSYDNGATWQPLNEYQKGELMQFNSEDCGGGIGTLYKWVVVDGEYECNGYDKYQKTQKYVSYDNGVTYNPVSPAVYDIGVLIENNSSDCGYMPSPTGGTKWIASYKNSYGSYTTKSKECDNTIIGGNEVPYSVNQTGIGIDEYTYLIKSVSIGECVKWIGYPDTSDGSFQNFDTLTSVTIPNSVRTINNYAFDGCHSLTGVTIPNSVVAIGYAAFNSCYSIQNVVIPNSVVNVAPPQGQLVDHNGVFGNCSALTSCTLSVNMTRIPENMFRSSGLLSIDIPTNITVIGDEAFSDCTGLTSCTIGSGVTSIGDYAFNNCTSLTSVTVNAITPPTLGSKAFDYTNNCPIYVPCESVSSYINSWGSLSARIRGIEPCNQEIMVYVTYIDGSRDDYVKYCDDTDTSMYIPDAYSAETVTYGDCVTSIDNRAFENRYNLKSVTISNSVTSIGDYAFYGCNGLTSVQLGDSLVSIGDCAFSGCSKAFTSLDFKNGVSIGNYAFANCETLTSATIDTNSIGYGVFKSCTALNSINIGSSTTTINNHMFAYCTSLTSVTIPDSVTNIGDYAFDSCGFTSITIPSGVTRIGDSAFNRCRDLASITVNATTPPTMGYSAFIGTNDCQIYVPAESVEAYKSASGWSYYKSRIHPIPNS